MNQRTYAEHQKILGFLLDGIKAIMEPGALITLVIRTPGHVKRTVVISEENDIRAAEDALAYHNDNKEHSQRTTLARS